ncbi:MAG TPA: YggT family protein [Rhizomicrobium sp.]|jgi:YggT family protein|nr:YggT family protein [Rhizomicrobium sp.]
MSIVFLSTLLRAITIVLDLCWFVVIAAVVASWLIAFGVLNMSNPTVRQIIQFLNAVTEPVFRQIRRVIPPIAGLDLSPIFVLLAIGLIQYFCDQLFTYLMFRV